MGKNQNGSVALWILGSIGAIVVLIILPVVFAFFGLITLPFLKFQSKVALNQGVITKTYNTDYCLNNYEWFKDTYNQIQQTDTKIANDQAELTQFKTDNGPSSSWNFAQSQQYSNITTDLTGAQNYKADLVGQYDSRTSQLNRVACKELPLYVNP